MSKEYNLNKVKNSLNLICNNIEFDYNIDEIMKDIIKDEKLEEKDYNKEYVLNITKRNFLKYFINKPEFILYEEGKLNYINEEENIYILFKTKDDKLIKNNLEFIIKEFNIIFWILKSIIRLNDNIKEINNLKIKYNIQDNQKNNITINKRYQNKEEYYNNLEKNVIRNIEYYIKCLLILNEGDYNDFDNKYKEYFDNIFLMIDINNKEEKDNIYNKLLNKINKK